MGLWTIPSLRMRVIGYALFVAFAIGLSWGSSNPTKVFFAGFAIVGSAAMLVCGETRWLSAFPLLEAEVGTRLIHLTVQRPSSWPQLQITRLAVRLTWRELHVRRGDTAHTDRA